MRSRSEWTASRKPLYVGGTLLLLVVCAGGAYQFIQGQRLDQYRQHCVAAQSAEDWEAVKKWGSLWAELDPTATDAWLALADAYGAEKDFANTAEVLGHVPVDDKRFLRAAAVRGDIQLSELHRARDAEATWKQMLSVAPHATLPRQRLIYLYSMTLQRQKLVEQIREAIFYRCEPPEAYFYLVALSVLNFSDGLVRVSEWLEQDPDNEAFIAARAIYLAKASPSRTLKQFGRAKTALGTIEHVEECLERFPHNRELLSYLIDRAIVDGDVSTVRSLVGQASDDADSDSRFWRYRGWLEDLDGDLSAAIAAYEHSLKLNPFDWRARHELSSLQRVAGDVEAAKENSEIAAMGKVVQQKFFELPNAQAAESQLMLDLLQYVGKCGDGRVYAALARRLGVQETEASPISFTRSGGVGAHSVAHRDVVLSQ